MFYLRLNAVKITDNGSVKSGFGLFGHDFSTVQLVSFVTAGNVDLPNLDGLLTARTPQERAAALQPAVAMALASRVFTRIERVTDHHEIRFGDTGFGVYESLQTPSSLNWVLMAVKSNQPLRDHATMVDQVLGSQEFDRTANSVVALLQGGAAVVNPAMAAAMQVTQLVADITLKSLANARDQQLGVVSTTLTQAEHYPSGLRDVVDAPDSTRNMRYDYSIFAYERAVAVS